jgi:hypothetical protein
VLAEHHVLGDLLAHHRHRLDAIAGHARDRDRCTNRRRRPRRSCGSGEGGSRASGGGGFDELEDVVFGHPATRARAADVADVDAVFLGDAAHERR